MVIHLTSEASNEAHLKSINSILLDFDGTLVDYYKNEGQALSTILEPYSLGKEKVLKILKDYRIINEQLWKEYELKNIDVEDLVVKRFKIISDKYKIEYDPFSFNEKYIEAFGKTVRAYEGIIDNLRNFREDFPDFKVIILTNGRDDIQHVRAERTGILPLVDKIISSDKAGFAKPAPEIFHYLVNETGIDLDTSIMIGDSLTSDIRGAVNMGMMNCYVGKIGSLIELDPKPRMITNDLLEFFEYFRTVVQ